MSLKLKFYFLNIFNKIRAVELGFSLLVVIWEKSEFLIAKIEILFNFIAFLRLLKDLLKEKNALQEEYTSVEYFPKVYIIKIIKIF